jgi:acetyl-CoA C-acetyltransferase/acetyl-CoA acyltransferase
MEAVTAAATAIEAGVGEFYLCVGVEVMSAYPLIFGRRMTDLYARLSRARSIGQRLAVLASFRPSFLKPRIALTEGLTDPTCGMIMGSTAEKLAREFSITREEADAFALESHQRARSARDTGRFERESIPHLPLEASEGTSAVLHDDGIRDEQTLEALAKLKPYFERPDGQVTVGNSCGISDGACALLDASKTAATRLGLAAPARIKSGSWAGLDPSRMGLGPVYASSGALRAGEAELEDVGAIEINEAFAAQVLACRSAFASDEFARKNLGRDTALGELDPGRTNPNGGAIALGHPVGATGARLLLTVAHEMQLRDAELGLATLCIGGGQGGAVLLERTT